MIGISTLLVSAVLLYSLAPASTTIQESCISCHQDYAQAWSDSIHSAAGVTCSSCMGGDPSKKDEGQAHEGVKPASDPESRVYYKNIPFTCGRCHEKQLEYFKRSAHYRSLVEDKMAPDCRTCHGSMGIEKVVPIKISEKCETCHTARGGAPSYVPKQVKKLFLLQEQIQVEIKKAEVAIAKAEEAGRDVGEGEKLLAESKAIMNESGKAWHEFELKNFEDMLYEALYYAYSTENNVGLPPETPIPEQPPRRGICGSVSILLLAVVPVISKKLLQI